MADEPGIRPVVLTMVVPLLELTRFMVPEENALVEGAEIHPVLQQHGSLYVDNDVKMRLKLELTRG